MPFPSLDFFRESLISRCQEEKALKGIRGNCNTPPDWHSTTSQSGGVSYLIRFKEQ